MTPAIRAIRFLSASSTVVGFAKGKIPRGPTPISTLHGPGSKRKSRRAHERAAGQPVDRDEREIGFASERVKGAKRSNRSSPTRARVWSGRRSFVDARQSVGMGFRIRRVSHERADVGKPNRATGSTSRVHSVTTAYFGGVAAVGGAAGAGAVGATTGVGASAAATGIAAGVAVLVSAPRSNRASSMCSKATWYVLGSRTGVSLDELLP